MMKKWIICFTAQQLYWNHNSTTEYHRVSKSRYAPEVISAGLFLPAFMNNAHELCSS